jgi:molecular chaperone GrpE
LSKKKQVEDEIKSAIENALADDRKEERQEKLDDDKELKIKELTDMLQRVQADFINYKNRTENEKKQLLEYGNAELIKKLLPVLDTFELALKNSQEPDKFRHGMELLYAQFLDVLKHEGLQKMEVAGKRFDPYKHEVLMKEHSDKEEDAILDELQKGYELKGKVVRHSKVKISAGKKQDKNN